MSRGLVKLVDEEKEFIISYETLFDFLKREREKADLQKLDKKFTAYLVEFMKEKDKELKNISVDSYEEKKNIERLIDNIKKLLADLYAKREKKIIGLALDKSRSKSTIVDMSAFLPEEKMLFDDLIETFDSYRQGYLFNVLQGKKPLIEKTENNSDQNSDEAEEDARKETSKEEKDKDMIMVRFLSPVPKFVGEELEEYGPFEEEDMANLPAAIAYLLIAKERAEEIQTN